MKKRALYIVAMCLLGSIANAEDVFTKRPLAAAPDGFTVSLAKKQRTFSLKEKIKAEESKTYFCNVNAASAENARGILYIGAECYDKNGKRIWPEHVYTVPQSETVLTEQAGAGTKTIAVKMVKGWERTKGRFAVFNTKADLSDLPNRTANKIVKAEPKDGNIIVTLNKPLKETYPQGTAVRLHKPDSIYSIWGAKSFKGGNSFSLKTQCPQSKLFPGTATFIPCIFTNTAGEIELSGIEFGTVKKAVSEK